jgi:septum formation protein
MTLWIASNPLILASASVVRKALLEAAGIPVEVHPANLDERFYEANLGLQTRAAIANVLAREKASIVAALHPGRLVLGADQTLALDDERFAKPADNAAAGAQLRALSGRTHHLYSAIAFVQDTMVLYEHIGSARLTMRSFSDLFLDRYLQTVGNTAIRSVGAYQVEGLGIQLFERIEGDYFTVLGLPLIPALDFLRQRGCLVS